MKHNMRLVIVLGSVLLFILFPVSGKAQTSVTIILNGRIAFASNRDGDMEIYTMKPDGTDMVQLTNDDAPDSDPNWSPDGQQIVFVSFTSPTIGELRIMNADGSNQRTLSTSSTNNFDPEWSPDGSRIAFISFQSGAFNIFTVHPDGSDLTQITFGQGDVVGGNFYQPTWSPDGQQLAYLMGELGGSAPGSIDSFGVYTIDLNTLASVALPAGSSYNNVDWSPDGQTIIFENVSLIHQLEAIHPDGTNYRVVSDSFEEQYSPAWSPDGQQIVFQMNGNDIGVMDANGQNVVNLTNTPDIWEEDPHWQPVVIVKNPGCQCSP